ncbi:hypothetical protein J437_LFUL001322 [Ladona fulva]|uniref:Uncharacterized protein n=1 Tax=Ladona fulva TaxID=123851 RepID=A0A8K0NUF4_LADFU|nr:hypothetical protein J437_LFUL001322 [Ladona fulva]
MRGNTNKQPRTEVAASSGCGEGVLWQGHTQQKTTQLNDDAVSKQISVTISTARAALHVGRETQRLGEGQLEVQNRGQTKVLKIKMKFFNLTILCVYAPTEEGNNEEKEAFYAKLEEEYCKIPKKKVAQKKGKKRKRDKDGKTMKRVNNKKNTLENPLQKRFTKK